MRRQQYQSQAHLLLMMLHYSLQQQLAVRIAASELVALAEIEPVFGVNSCYYLRG